MASKSVMKSFIGLWHNIAIWKKDFGPRFSRIRMKYILFYSSVALLALILIVFLNNVRNPILCTNQQSRNARDEICSRYRQGEIGGDFCQDFCALSKTQDGKVSNLEPVGCSHWHSNKEIVFRAKMLDQGKHVYVKGWMDHSTKPDSIPLNDESHSANLPSAADFDKMLTQYLWDNMGIKIPGSNKQGDGAISKLFPGFHPDVYSLLEAETMWGLVQDEEYVLSRLYSAELDVFPSMYGRCGSAYVVEDLEPLPDAQKSLQVKGSFDEFAKASSLGLALLDLLDELETLFDEPFHLCDIKPEHFGISDQGRMKFIDLDNAGLRSAIEKTVQLGQSGTGDCLKHSDCNYFDCKGICNLVTGRCESKIANNNLQVLCEKIFLSRSKSPLLAAAEAATGSTSGLLTSKHSNKRIRRNLELCANPSKSKDPEVRISAPSKVKLDLYKSLEEILSFSESI